MSYYAIIVGAFLVAGLALTAYGWRVFQKGRQVRQWPSVPGRIVRAEEISAEDDLLPDIRFRYVVDGRDYEGRLQFPAGTAPMPGFARHQVEKYPLGREVTVYYDPRCPERASLEPGAADDWMLLATGIGVTLLGVGALFFRG